MNLNKTLSKIPLLKRLLCLPGHITISFFHDDPSSEAFMVYFNLHKRAEYIRITVISHDNNRYIADIPPISGSRGYFVTFDDLKDNSGNSFNGPIKEILATSNFGTEHFKVTGHKVCKVY